MSATAHTPERCSCPECLALDRRWPDDGWQMKLPVGSGTAVDVVHHLQRTRLPSSTEAALQRGIEEALTAGGFGFEREKRLAAGERIDFLVVGGIGIEAKTRCPKRSIYRQLERYARHDAVTALILVTGTALGLPPLLKGKPVYLVSIGRGAL